MQSGLQLILALGLVIAGGWLMYAVISGSPLFPVFPSGKFAEANKPGTTSNQPGSQTNKFGPYPA